MAGTATLGNPLLLADILPEAIPGSIRRSEHFLSFLKKIVEYLKLRMRTNDVEEQTPLKFLHHLHEITALDRKPLKFTYSRLNSLMQTLEISSVQDYNSLQDVANLATLVSTYIEGFAIIIEPKVCM
jgi:DNA excision repair protein ERCC-2